MNLGGEFVGGDNTMRLFGKVNCPEETQLSAFVARTLPTSNRAAIEQHLANCDDCRESVALLVYLQHRDTDSDDSAEVASGASAMPIGGEELKAQTANVMSLIAADERKLRFGIAAAEKRGFSLFRMLPKPVFALAAMLIVALVSWMGYMAFKPRPSTEMATVTVAKAITEHGRRTKTMMNGLPYAPYNAERGPLQQQVKAALMYAAAAQDLKNTQSSSTPADQRLVLAKVLVASAQDENINDALAILGELSQKGEKSAELYNILGCAHHTRDEYKAAVDAFNNALELDPNMTHALFNRAAALRDQAAESTSSEEAKRCYAQARADLERLSVLLQSSSDSEWKQEVAAALNEETPKN